ncbi:GCD14-domain-containing protein [Ceraceosorus guamensis]|uniref:tRNA (adenine(58)-N(1))-methyltransferase catalytic subunit TRM61 n=1 Tax=Ceraceosorus guamensis TaxID=1522189 RepID=A0A316VVS5_9BASI|nr:GCD14-domain-containing protein [Ceraceosorus guamensis]PWN41559.1 GCD14-domain-containing protein [Ceraceosorus guamensis]
MVCPTSSTSIAHTNSSQAVSSCKRRSRLIQAGDLVIVHLSRDKTPVPLCVTPGRELNNAWGRFPHSDMVGRPFGSRVYSTSNRKGHVFLLAPTPELWTTALPHRTQILYAPDMSFITSRLALMPGSRIVEAGTGSGSFTHFLARTVSRRAQWGARGAWGAQGSEGTEVRGQSSGGLREEGEGAGSTAVSKDPDACVPDGFGRVWSFEFNAVRAEKARHEFDAHGLSPGTVQLQHRNVCKDGFGLTGVADAIFLDLPAPWEALESAAQTLRLDRLGRICTFSPCIEQVLKTAEGLRAGGWTDIETFETSVRIHDSLSTPLVAPMLDVSQAVERINRQLRVKGERRLNQIAKAKDRRAKRLREAEEDEQSNNAATATERDASPGGNSIEHGNKSSNKKTKVDAYGASNRNGQDPSYAVASDMLATRSAQETQHDATKGHDGAESEESDATKMTSVPMRVTVASNRPGRQYPARDLEASNVYGRVQPEVKFTSYLTFATRRPQLLTFDKGAIKGADSAALPAEREVTHGMPDEKCEVAKAATDAL